MASRQPPSSKDTGGTCPRCQVYSNFTFKQYVTTVYEPQTVTEAQARERFHDESETSLLRRGGQLEYRKDRLAVERVIYALCQRCEKVTLVIERFRFTGWVVVGHWPPGDIVVPNHVPEKIEALFMEAASCLKTGAPRGAAIMTRTTIDAAIQDCGASGPDTKQRIVSMTNQLPQLLIDMAPELRLGGNDATHEFEHNWSVDESQELMEFLRQLLHHLYEVPQRLKAVQRKTARRRSAK